MSFVPHILHCAWGFILVIYSCIFAYSIHNEGIYLLYQGGLNQKIFDLDRIKFQIYVSTNLVEIMFDYCNICSLTTMIQ